LSTPFGGPFILFFLFFSGQAPCGSPKIWTERGDLWYNSQRPAIILIICRPYGHGKLYRAILRIHGIIASS
jgi:hypothetical protein